jgi:SAM-dependent methyltransferase
MRSNTSNFWDQSFEEYETAVRQSDLIAGVVFPLLAGRLKQSDKVLDFGGGGGLLLPSLLHCRELWLFDISAAAVQKAAAAGDIPGERCVSEIGKLPDCYFTAVVACFVLMSAKTALEERSVVESIYRLLGQNGRALFVITDPVNRGEEFSWFKTEFLAQESVSAEVDLPFKVTLLDRQRSPILEILNFHRPLDVTLANIEKSGLNIKLIRPIQDFASQGFCSNKSPYLIIEAEKVA